MKRITGLSYNDSDKLYELLKDDNNFTYEISEGGFVTNDAVVVGIDRSPYQCCLYAFSKIGENNIDKWECYILEKFKTQAR